MAITASVQRGLLHLDFTDHGHIAMQGFQHSEWRLDNLVDEHHTRMYTVDSKETNGKESSPIPGRNLCDHAKDYMTAILEFSSTGGASLTKCIHYYIFNCRIEIT